MLSIAVVSHLLVTILVSKCMFLSSAGGDVIYSGRFTSTSNHISIEMHVSIFSWG